MAISIKVFSGATEKGSVTLTQHEAQAIQRSLSGETVDEKLQDLVDRIVERFGAKKAVGTSWWDYQLERTGKTHDEALAMGLDALEGAPDAS